ncbi:MAG: MFS transporter, partial [Rubrivivax sp.]
MAAEREIDLQGWIQIAASTAGVAVCVIPVSILSLGVFIKPLGDAFGWGRGEISLALTILSFAMALALPFAGRLIDVFGVRGPLVGSLLLYGVGVAATPFLLDSFGLVGLYGGALWLGIVGAPSSTVGYVKILSGRFTRSRGLAMGFAMSGIAVGGAITPLLAATLIEAYGWHGGFYGLAALPLIVGLIVAMIVREPDHLNAKTDRAAVAGMTSAEALRTPVFWMMLLLFLVAATANHGIQIHLAPLLSDLGLTPDRAALG